MLGQGIATLFGKPADPEDGGLMSQNHLTQVRIQGYFILEGEGVWLVVGNVWRLEAGALVAVHAGQVTMFL